MTRGRGEASGVARASLLPAEACGLRPVTRSYRDVTNDAREAPGPRAPRRRPPTRGASGRGVALRGCVHSGDFPQPPVLSAPSRRKPAGSLPSVSPVHAQ